MGIASDLSPFGGIVLTAGLLIVAKLLLTLRYWFLLRSNQALEPPKYPNKDPIFGIDLFFAYAEAFKAGTWLDWTFGHFFTYGKTFQCTYLGQTVIKTVDPEISKCFHSTHYTDFGIKPIRGGGCAALFGKSIVTEDGEFAHHRRNWMRPAFQRAHVVDFDRMGKQIEDFLALLPDDDSTVDLAPFLARFNLDTSSDFIFGKSLDALRNPDGPVEEFREAFTYAVRVSGIHTMLGPWLMHMHRDKKFKPACEIVYRHVDQCVQEALERREKRVGGKAEAEDRIRLIDALAGETQDPMDLRWEAIAVFNPGHKLTSVIMTNAFFLLARNPKMYQRLREEILPTQDKPLSYDLLKSYKLVGFTIKETHRLYTTATLNPRVALRDTVLPKGGGPDGQSPLFVRKGTCIEMHYRAMHRHPDLWGADAAEFNPDRWRDARPGWAFMPFGGGPRYCVGQDLAFTEIAYMLVVMLRRFRAIENRDSEEKWVEQMSMTFESKNGAKVALYKA